MRNPAILRSTSAFATTLVLLLFFLEPSALPGQTLHTYVYTDLDGLPSAKVFDIDQDGDGVMWFATSAGLAAFDGVKWEDVDGPPSFDGEPCHFIEMDAAGRMWAAWSVI